MEIYLHRIEDIWVGSVNRENSNHVELNLTNEDGQTLSLKLWFVNRQHLEQLVNEFTDDRTRDRDARREAEAQ